MNTSARKLRTLLILISVYAVGFVITEAQTGVPNSKASHLTDSGLIMEDALRSIQAGKPQLLLYQLCSAEILKCGDSVGQLDTTLLDWDQIQGEIIDFVSSWTSLHGNGARTFRFWGDVCLKLAIPNKDPDLLAKAICMYDSAFLTDSIDPGDNYVEAISYYANELNRSNEEDSAFSLCCRALSVNPSYRPCFDSLSEWALTPQWMDSAISHMKHSGALTDSTSYRTSLDLHERRILNSSQAAGGVVVQAGWLDSVLAVLVICKNEGHVALPDLYRRVDELYTAVRKKKGEGFRQSAVDFLDKALSEGVANPIGYCSLAEALLELVDTKNDPDDSLLFWMKSWAACSECASHSKRNYKDCCKELCQKLPEILDALPQGTIIPCDSLKLFFETVATKYCDKDARKDLLSYLASSCEVVAQSSRLRKTADRMWVSNDPKAEQTYKMSLVYDRSNKGRAHSLYRLALIHCRDSLGNKQYNTDSAKGLLWDADKVEENASRDLLHQGLRRLVDRRFKDAIEKFRSAIEDLPNDPDIAYCLALAERFRANELLSEDKLCDGAWHLELSRKAFVSAGVIFGQHYPDLNDNANRVKIDADSLADDHSQTVGGCFASLETQMSEWIGSQQYREIIREYATIVQRFPDSFITSGVYFRLGGAYYGDGSFLEAEEAYREILSSDSTDPRGHLGVGLARDTLSRLDPTRPNDAINSYRKAVKYLPELGGDQQIENSVYFHLSRFLIDSADPTNIIEGCSYVCDTTLFNDPHFKRKVDDLKKHCDCEDKSTNPDSTSGDEGP